MDYNHLYKKYLEAKSVATLTSSDIEKKRLELSGLEGRLAEERKELSLAGSSLNKSLKRRLRYQKKVLDVADEVLKEKYYGTVIQLLENPSSRILSFSCREFVRKKRLLQDDYDAVYKLGEDIAKDVEYGQEDLQKLSQKISKRHDSSLGFYLSALVNKIVPKGGKITLNLNVPLDGIGAYLEDVTLNMIGDVRNMAGYRMKKDAKLVISGSAGDGLGFGLEGGKIKVKGNLTCRAEKKSAFKTIIFNRLKEETMGIKRDWQESMKNRKMSVEKYVNHIKTNPQIYGELTEDQLNLLKACIKYKDSKTYLGFIGISLRFKKDTGKGQEEIDHEFKKFEKILSYNV